MRRYLRERLRLTVLGDERGSSLVLTIFYGAFALLLILLVVAATSLSLDRNRLFGIADGAALAGAEAFELSAVSTAGEGFTAALQDAAVQQAVQEHLAVVPRGSLEELVVESAGTPDGVSAEVTLSAWWRPPMLTMLVPAGIRIEVTATARSVLR
ncbi:putative Flp pilus-assembly TadE/G-like protein [Microterricola gilva]|uniref:Putative Flp pilus-assembly TadE/G-like protein n=1 Tax=Microterricola gilva TaxID=393267 RepID=A0A4Q8AKX4_9MICO|nr:pilus assembly protein TadG-related protein [Microterricola gilva]RZU64583.1 putative Flp pilus-assembly TadE/G-like protein [Microterricola gilva]